MSEKHIHFLLGSDDYEIQRRVDKFGSKFTDPTIAGMNLSRFDARVATESDLVKITNSMPFLAEQRLVILDYVLKKYDRPDIQKKFLDFLEKIPPFTRLVITHTEAIKEVSKNWLIKWIEKNDERAEYKIFSLPTEKEMLGWIVAEVKHQGGKIEPPAARELSELTGEDTRQAAQEITKLLTYVNYAHPIGLEDVQAVSILTASVSIFDLVDAIGTRNGKEAQHLYYRLLEEKDAFEIFPLVLRQFRLLILARDVLDSGGTFADIKILPGYNNSEYVAKKIMEQVKNFNIQSLKMIYHRLLAMDEAGKTGVMPLETSLHTFIIEVTSQ